MGEKKCLELSSQLFTLLKRNLNAAAGPVRCKYEIDIATEFVRNQVAYQFSPVAGLG